jgi:hypothetical protein
MSDGSLFREGCFLINWWAEQGKYWRKASNHWPQQIIPLADLAETFALYSAERSAKTVQS